MKLSEIVAYLNQMDSTDVGAICANTEHELEAVLKSIESKTIDPGAYKTRILRRYKSVKQELEQFNWVFNNLKLDLEAAIAKHEQEIYAEHQRVYSDVIRWESNDFILARRLNTDDESRILLENRIKNYTDWRLPGMIIRPGVEKFVEHLVPLDPLYLVDHNRELLEPALNNFNEVYRNRLRDYVIKENSDEFLSALPNQQFGTVFAYNFFNYKTIELIEQYLTEIYHKLRDGGMLIMTFNDCDWAHGVELAEKNFMTYTPGKKIKAMAERIGYEIMFYHRGQGDLVWLELQRPGTIRSLRGGQTLAKIVRK